MPDVIDAIVPDDVVDLSLSNGDHETLTVVDVSPQATRSFVDGHISAVEPIRSQDEDATYVPKARSRLRVSEKRVSVYIDHIARARQYGSVDGFGEYDLANDLPTSITDLAAEPVDGGNDGTA